VTDPTTPERAAGPRRVSQLLEPFRYVANDARLSSLLLLAATGIALLWANASFGATYETIWERPFSMGAGGHAITLSVRGWINDALMALFFLVVGLEIERELLVGSLSSARAAALPIAAAIGGMLVPAACYLAVAGRGIDAHGWGVPMATDIAFALGLLGLLAPGVPASVRTFLAALAIVDDLGAILVIALAYGAAPDWTALALAVVCVAALLGLRLFNVQAISLYVLASVPLWVMLHAGGIHPSLTGVLLAFAMPTRARRDDQASPSVRTEHALHVWVTVGVLPLFALANAGVNLREAFAASAPLAAMGGVALGLIVGKPVGIVGASWLAVRARVAELPSGLDWSRVAIVGAFGGIGFTMAIFVTGLAFTNPVTAGAVKAAVLVASLGAAAVGAVIVRLTERRLG
jgi:Na+:H+ antiporter, NhaA family